MSTRNLAAVVIAAILATPTLAETYGFGRPATMQELAGWDIDVRPDGRGLPAGSGNAAQGKPLYEAKCAACHGMKGEGGLADRLVGGKGSLNTEKPVMTVGSYWPYASTLYDYIFRAMPFTAPQSLKPNEVYAISAYILHMNGIIGEKDVMDAKSLPKVQMPNRKGFTADPRPDVKSVACEPGCKP